MQPLISVIVPVYNGQDYLTNCIESIEEQTYSNLEILLIDDGSTDNTPVLCRELAKTYSNIRVRTLKDEGVSAARNAGLDLASGEYVTFVDADDRLLCGTLEILQRCILETGGDVAGCGFVPFGSKEEWEQIRQTGAHIGQAAGEGEPGRKAKAGEDRETAYREYDPETFLREELLRGNSRCWSKLYRRAAVKDVRFRRGLTIGEDMLFLVELLPGIQKIVETEYSGYGYFQNPAGAMNREFKPSYMDQITCWETARELICEMDRELYEEVTTILLMAILLTAGKLAMLDGRERRECRRYVALCHDKLNREMQSREAAAGLPWGYRVKAALFGRAPWFYLRLYHFRKYAK